MARSKPNKPLKLPHKQQIEELNNQNKTENTPNITPQTTKTNKKATGTEERSVKRNITQKKYVRNPEKYHTTKETNSLDKSTEKITINNS
jgi:hypothetical protein